MAQACFNVSQFEMNNGNILKCINDLVTILFFLSLKKSQTSFKIINSNKWFTQINVQIANNIESNT